MTDSCCGTLSQWKTGCVPSLSGVIENDSVCGNGSCCEFTLWKLAFLIAGGFLAFFFFLLCVRHQRRRRMLNGQIVVNTNQYGQPIIGGLQQQPVAYGGQPCGPVGDGGVYGQPTPAYGQPQPGNNQCQPQPAAVNVWGAESSQPPAPGGWSAEPPAGQQQQYGQTSGYNTK